MRHFKLNIFLCLLAIIVSTVFMAYSFIKEEYSYSILACIVLICLVIGLWTLIKRLIHTMQSFASGLEMNDNSMRFDFGDSDMELKEMGQTMNRIASIYKNNRSELETRKIYYDRILKVMTHEMRNGITPVIALTSDIQNKPNKYHGENLVETISVIREQSMEIKRFLDSYHELTHIPEPKKETVTATEFMDSVRKGISGIVPGMDIGNIVQFVVSPNATLFIDKGMMLQVMRNMIKNALESVAKVENPSVVVTITISGSSALVTIEDNGPGIPQHIMQNLYQPFITSKQNGTGIGLFISRQIVRLHGGELLIRNHPAKGVAVQITIS